jgi:hypothetical protein
MLAGPLGSVVLVEMTSSNFIRQPFLLYSLGIGPFSLAFLLADSKPAVDPSSWGRKRFRDFGRFIV